MDFTLAGGGLTVSKDYIMLPNFSYDCYPKDGEVNRILNYMQYAIDDTAQQIHFYRQDELLPVLENLEKAKLEYLKWCFPDSGEKYQVDIYGEYSNEIQFSVKIDTVESFEEIYYHRFLNNYIVKSELIQICEECDNAFLGDDSYCSQSCRYYGEHV
jgi:hypothetical protein